MKIRFIGDVHQRYHLYLPLLKACDYSIQVGDLGLDYRLLLNKFDHNKHKFQSGNHDNFDKNDDLNYWNVPFSLGDYGIHQIENLKIFYVRGGWSIDHAWRQKQQSWPNKGPVTWWEEEELANTDLEKAIELYKQEKPNVVITHECPYDIVQYVTNPDFCLNFGYPSGTIKTRTNIALQTMFDYHQPKKYFFGHYHQRWEDTINGTDFICLDMCRSIDQTSNFYDLYLED